LGDETAGWDTGSEPFSSCDLAGLKDPDDFGQLPGPPWAAAEFAQDAPGFQLGVGALAGGSQPGMGTSRSRPPLAALIEQAAAGR